MADGLKSGVLGVGSGVMKTMGAMGKRFGTSSAKSRDRADLTGSAPDAAGALAAAEALAAANPFTKLGGRKSPANPFDADAAAAAPARRRRRHRCRRARRRPPPRPPTARRRDRANGTAAVLVAQFRLGEQKLGLHLNDANVVLRVDDGGLAYAEGTLRIGDKITEVNGEPTGGVAVKELLRGAGLDVAFTISRAGAPAAPAEVETGDGDGDEEAGEEGWVFEENGGEAVGGDGGAEAARRRGSVEQLLHSFSPVLMRWGRAAAPADDAADGTATPPPAKAGDAAGAPAAADGDGTRDGAGAPAPVRRGHRRNHAAVLANANGGPSMASLLRKLPSFSEIVAQVASPRAWRRRRGGGGGAPQSTPPARPDSAARRRSAAAARTASARPRWRAQIGGVVAESCCGRRRADGGADENGGAGEDAEGEEEEHWVYQRAGGRRGGGGGRRGARTRALAQLLAGGAVQQPTALPDGERVVGSAMLRSPRSPPTRRRRSRAAPQPRRCGRRAAADGDAPAANEHLLRSDGDDDGDDGASVSALVGELRVRATYRPFGGREEAAVDEYGFRVPPAHARTPRAPSVARKGRRWVAQWNAHARALRRAVPDEARSLVLSLLSMGCRHSTALTCGCRSRAPSPSAARRAARTGRWPPTLRRCHRALPVDPDLPRTFPQQADFGDDGLTRTALRRSWSPMRRST